MTIKIQVEIVGVLRQLSGKSIISLEFDSFVVVDDVISELAKNLSSKFKQALIDPELNNLRPNVLVLLNKTEIGVLDGLRTKVENGDKLVFVPVSHGG